MLNMNVKKKLKILRDLRDFTSCCRTQFKKSFYNFNFLRDAGSRKTSPELQFLQNIIIFISTTFLVVLVTNECT